MPPPVGTLSSTRYTIVVDAGSSGSRLIIYSYQDPEAERNEIVNSIRDRYKSKEYRKGKGKAQVEDEIRWEMENSLKRLVKVEKGAEGDNWMKKAEPGISSMSPGNIPQYLSPLLSHAMDQIPPSQHRNTPIYVLATAGMRLLDESARNAILSATCQTLRTQYPFIVGKADQYGPCGDHVRVASGEEEGMWGWVAVNYLMDGFGHVPSDSFSSPGEANTILPLPEVEKEKEASLEKGISPTLVDTKHLHPTFGFLDMGGASTQIAFSPSIDELERSKFPPEELKSVSLRLLSGQAVEWPLFVASWLGFGTNRVRERYIETKVLEWQKENERLSSAMTAGTSSTIPTASASLFKPIEDPCLPKGLKLPPTSPLMPAFIGTGSFSECLESLQPLLDTTAPCPPPSSHCLFAGLPTPHIDFEREDQRGFIGISEYWYTAQQVLGLGGVWDWAEWEKGMEGFCARDWGDIKDGFQRDHGLEGTAVDVSRLEMQCFKGAWISNVLHEGIGIPRISDAQGNLTLTGKDGGDLNGEASRRAKQKGLVSKKNTHFQSVDTIGETAVSWTLGKMVIEASKAVKPHGHDPKTIGTHSRWSQAWNVGKGKFGKAIGIPKLEGKLNEYGVDVFWVYLAFLLLIVGIAYSTLRRRFWLTRATIYKRRRSDAGEVRDWMRKRSQVIASEEGSIPSTPRKGLFSTSRFKPLAYRVSSVMSKFARSGRNDSASRSLNGRAAPATGPPSHINLPDRPDAYSTTTSMSLPTSPRNENYFTPAFAETPSGPNHDISLTEVVSHNSPSKSALGLFNGNSRMLNHKPSGSNLRSKRSVPFPMTTTNGDTSSGGWNDPPGAVLNSASEYLGPKAGSALSRSSSRINLEEYGMTGLASRPVSRGPNADDPGGP